MTTQIDVAFKFQKDVKRLKRKYPAITDEVRKLVIQLENDERPGDKIPNVGYDVYKVRLKNPSAQRGKSGGFRVIYYVQIENLLTLLTVYTKTEQTDISPDNIREILGNMRLADEENDNE
jgi:mRNA-degrading endonuclease RelE of RelBE toxin-antitoxin system